MSKFFRKNDLISSNQSGFKSGDSCINQLLSINHEIYKSFQCGWHVRDVFLAIFKVFDEVWHDGIMLTLEQNGVSGNIHDISQDFF